MRRFIAAALLAGTAGLTTLVATAGVTGQPLAGTTGINCCQPD